MNYIKKAIDYLNGISEPKPICYQKALGVKNKFSGMLAQKQWRVLDRSDYQLDLRTAKTSNAILEFQYDDESTEVFIIIKCSKPDGSKITELYKTMPNGELEYGGIKYNQSGDQVLFGDANNFVIRCSNFEQPRPINKIRSIEIEDEA